MDNDKFNNARVQDVADSTMFLLNHLQDLRAELQPHAVVSVLLSLCTAWGLQPQDLFTKTKNLMKFADGQRRPEFRVVDAYIAGELTKP